MADKLSTPPATLDDAVGGCRMRICAEDKTGDSHRRVTNNREVGSRTRKRPRLAGSEPTKEAPVTSASFECLMDDIVLLILEFVLDPGSSAFWPWRLHRDRLVRSTYHPYAIEKFWRPYSVFCSVNRKWRTVVQRLVQTQRKEQLERKMSTFTEGTWDCFELIYQPQGCSLPEYLSGGTKRPWRTREDARLPPQGLLFFRRQSRSNAYQEFFSMHGKLTNKIRMLSTRMVETSFWDVMIPPKAIDRVTNTTSVRRITNDFRDDPLIFVGRHAIGKGGWCELKKGAGMEEPWLTVEGGVVVPDDKVELLPIIVRHPGGGILPSLALASRVGPDNCMHFLQNHFL